MPKPASHQRIEKPVGPPSSDHMPTNPAKPGTIDREHADTLQLECAMVFYSRDAPPSLESNFLPLINAQSRKVNYFWTAL